MLWLASLAPIFLALEIVQVVVLERYIGLKTLEREVDPRDLALPTWLAVLWIVFQKVYLLWMILLLTETNLWLPSVVMLSATLAGLLIRRWAGLRFALVVITFETAIRVGMLLVVFKVWRAS